MNTYVPVYAWCYIYMLYHLRNKLIRVKILTSYTFTENVAIFKQRFVDKQVQIGISVMCTGEFGYREIVVDHMTNFEE